METMYDRYRAGWNYFYRDADGQPQSLKATEEAPVPKAPADWTREDVTRFADDDGREYHVPSWDLAAFTKGMKDEGLTAHRMFRMRMKGSNIGDAIMGNVGIADQWVSDSPAHKSHLADLERRGFERIHDIGMPNMIETIFSPKTYKDYYSKGENWKDLPENMVRGAAGATIAGGTGIIDGIAGLVLNGGAFVSDAVGATDQAAQLREMKRLVDEKADKVLDFTVDNVLGEAFFNEGDGTRELSKGGLQAAEALGSLYGLGGTTKVGAKAISATGKVNEANAAKLALTTLMTSGSFEEQKSAIEQRGEDPNTLRANVSAGVSAAVTAAITPLYGKLVGVLGKEESGRVIQKSIPELLKMGALDTLEGGALAGVDATGKEIADVIAGGHDTIENRAKRVYTNMLVGSALVAVTKVAGIKNLIQTERTNYCRAAAIQGDIALETTGRGMPLMQSKGVCPDVSRVTVNSEVVFNDGTVYRPGRAERTVTKPGGAYGENGTRTIPAREAEIITADGTILNAEGKVKGMTAGSMKLMKQRGEVTTPEEYVYRSTDNEANAKWRVLDPMTGEVIDGAEVIKGAMPESVKNWFEAKSKGEAKLPELDAEGYAYMSLYNRALSGDMHTSRTAQLALEQASKGTITYEQAANIANDAFEATGIGSKIYGMPKGAAKGASADTAETTSYRMLPSESDPIAVDPGPNRTFNALPKETVDNAKKLITLINEGDIASESVDLTDLPKNPLGITGEPPRTSDKVIILEREDGTKTVLTGTNLIADARKNGAKTVEATVVQEDDGWTYERAEALAYVDALQRGEISMADAVRAIGKLDISAEELPKVPEGSEELIASAYQIAERLNPEVLYRLDDGNIGIYAALSGQCNMRTNGLGWEEIQTKLINTMPSFADEDQASIAGTIAANIPELEGERIWQIAEWTAAHAGEANVNDLLNQGERGIREIEKLMASDEVGTTPVEQKDGSFKTVNELEASAAVKGEGVAEAIRKTEVDKRFELQPVEGAENTFHCARFKEVHVTTAVDENNAEIWSVKGLDIREMLDSRNRLDMGRFLSELAEKAEEAGREVDLGDTATVEVADELVKNYREQGRETIMANRTKSVLKILDQGGLVDQVVSDEGDFNAMLEKFPEGERLVKDGKTYGFYADGKIYLNKAYFGTKIGLNTAIHEFAHPAVISTKRANPALYKRGMDLITETDYYKAVKDHADYKGKSEEYIREEALVRLLSDRLENIKANVPAKIYKEIEEFVTAFWKRFGEVQGIRDLTPAMVQTMTIEDIADAIGAEMMSGKTFAASNLSAIEGAFKAQLDRYAKYKNKLTPRAKDAWKAIERTWKKFDEDQKKSLETYADVESESGKRYRKAFENLRKYDKRRAEISKRVKEQIRKNPNKGQESVVRSSRDWYIANATENPTSPFAYLAAHPNGIISIPKPGSEEWGWWQMVTDGMNKEERRDLARLLGGRNYTANKGHSNDTVVRNYYEYVTGEMPTAEEEAGLPNFEDFMSEVLEGEAQYQTWKQGGMRSLDELRQEYEEGQMEAERRAQYEAELEYMRENEEARIEAERSGAFNDDVDLEDIPFARGGAGKKTRLTIEKSREEREAIKLLPELYGIAETARIKANLEKHRGTPWHTQTIESILIRKDMQDLLEGREPTHKSKLNSPRLENVRTAIKNGPEGIFGYIQAHHVIGHATKPVNAINGSFTDCDPSEACAKFCYASRGHYAYASPAVKSEMITWAVKRDPIRVAKMIHNEYVCMPEYEIKKALRLFDKGDISEAWLPVIKYLNNAGIRVQIFSKRPEILRKVDANQNVVMLSIDKSNFDMAEKYPNLPLSFVLSDESELAFLETQKERFQKHGGVILPISDENDTIINEVSEKLPAWARPYRCVINAGKVQLANGAWSCQRCDSKGGVGCFYHRTAMIKAKIEQAKIDDRPLTARTAKEINEAVATLEKHIKDVIHDDAVRNKLLENLLNLSAEVSKGIDATADEAYLDAPGEAREGVSGAAEDLRLSRSVFVAGRARVAEDAGAGERTVGSLTASKELASQASTPLNEKRDHRFISLPISELEWLRKNLTGDAVPSHIAKRIPGGAAAAHTRDGRIIIDADVFGLIDKTDMAAEKDFLKEHGFFRNEDSAWALRALPSEIAAERQRSVEALGERLMKLEEKRIKGEDDGGQTAARRIFADQLATIIMGLKSSAPGTLGRIKTIGKTLSEKLGVLSNELGGEADSFLDRMGGYAEGERVRSTQERVHEMFGIFLVAPETVRENMPSWYDAIVDTIAEDPKLSSAFHDLTIRSMSEQAGGFLIDQIRKSQSRAAEERFAKLRQEGEEPIKTTSSSRERVIVGFHDRMAPVVIRLGDSLKTWLKAKKETLKHCKNENERRQVEHMIDARRDNLARAIKQIELSRTAFERGGYNEGRRYFLKMLLLENEASKKWGLTEDDRSLYLDLKRVIETQGRASSFGISPRQAQLQLNVLEKRLGSTKTAKLHEYGRKFFAVFEQEVLNDPRVEQAFGRGFVDYCLSQTNYVTTKRTFSQEELDQIDAIRARMKEAGVRGGDNVHEQIFKYIGRHGGSSEDAFTAKLVGSFAAKQEVRSATWEKHDKMMEFVRRNALIIELKKALLEFGVTGVSDHQRTDAMAPKNNRYGHLDYIEDGKKRTLVVPRQIADGFAKDPNNFKAIKELHGFCRKLWIDWNLAYSPRNLNRNMSSIESNMPGMHETWLKSITRAIFPGLAPTTDILTHVIARNLGAKATPVLGFLFGKHVPVYFAPKAARIATILQDPSTWQEKLWKAEERGDLAEVEERMSDLHDALEMLRGNMFVSLKQGISGETNGFANDIMNAKGFKMLTQVEKNAKTKLAKTLDKLAWLFKKNAEHQVFEDDYAKAIAYLHDRMAYALERSPAESGLMVKKNVSIPEGERSGTGKTVLQTFFNQFYNMVEKGNVRHWKAYNKRPGETFAKDAVKLVGRIMNKLVMLGVLSKILLDAADGDEEKARSGKLGGIYRWAEECRKAYKNESKYMRKHYNATPIWTSKSGYTSIVFGMPLSDEEKLTAPIADMLTDYTAARMGIGTSPKLGEAVSDLTVGSISPDFQTTTAIVDLWRNTIGAMSENPRSAFTGAPKFDEDVYALRGESVEGFVDYATATAKLLWDECGARGFYQFEREGVDKGQGEAHEFIYKALNRLPVVSPLLRSMFKIQVGSPERDAEVLTEAEKRLMHIERSCAKKLLERSIKAGVAFEEAAPEEYEAQILKWGKTYGLDERQMHRIEMRYINAYRQFEADEETARERSKSKFMRRGRRIEDLDLDFILDRGDH